jgi:hypothetical protein
VLLISCLHIRMFFSLFPFYLVKLCLVFTNLSYVTAM